MANFLKLFTDYEEYSEYISNVGELVRPEICYYRNGKLVSFQPIILKIMCGDNIIGETCQCTAVAKGKKKKCSWFISKGGAYASIDKNGLLTINPIANESSITIMCSQNGLFAQKDCLVTYLSGSNVETEVVVVKNDDGTTTETSSIITTNADGSSSEVINSTVYSESGNVESSSCTNTNTNSDGSFSSLTENFDADGVKTSSSNSIGDVLGNVDTQEKEYDEEGNYKVVGYTIDTSHNVSGTGRNVSGGALNTEYYTFNPTVGFELFIWFKFDISVAPNNGFQSTAMSAKVDKTNTTYYGFDIRRQDNTKIRVGYCLNDGVNTQPMINKTSDNIYKVKITYNPSLSEKNFTVLNVLTGKKLAEKSGYFPDIEAVRNIRLTLGGLYENDGTGKLIRVSNIDVYDFYIKRI